MPSPENDHVHEMNRQLVRDFYAKGDDTTPDDFKRVYADFLDGFAIPQDAAFEYVNAGGVAAIWCSAPGAATDRALIHFHSGGYVIGSAKGYRQFGARLSAATGVRVLLPDYRLAPEFQFPVPADDAIAAYRWLAGEMGASNLIVSGDSAGGALTMIVLQTIRDAGEELPLAGICMSPFADLAGTGDSMKSNEECDPLVDGPMVEGMAMMYVGETGDALKNPKVSPLYGEFAGLPPLLMFAGDIECLRDDARRCAAKAQAAGVEVTHFEGEGMCHIWPIFADRLPEARETLERVGAFTNEHFAVASAH